jgi:hypothetical protein
MDIWSFRDKHKDQPAFITGSGPSLVEVKKLDLDLGQVVKIGVNAGIDYYPKDDAGLPTPDYLFFLDRRCETHPYFKRGMKSGAVKILLRDNRPLPQKGEGDGATVCPNAEKSFATTTGHYPNIIRIDRGQFGIFGGVLLPAMRVAIEVFGCTNLILAGFDFCRIADKEGNVQHYYNGAPTDCERGEIARAIDQSGATVWQDRHLIRQHKVCQDYIKVAVMEKGIRFYRLTERGMLHKKLVVPITKFQAERIMKWTK